MMDRPDSVEQGAQAFVLSRRLWVVLLLIVLVAAGFRFVNLGGIPIGLFRDEAEKGYTALQLWETGRQGVFLPTGEVQASGLFPAFAEAGLVYTSAIYQYLSAPIVGVFGLSVVTTRLAAAICGLLTVVATFFLARRIECGAHQHSRVMIAHDHQVIIAFAAAAFMAVSPTHVVFSRWAQQGVTVPLWATLGLILLVAVPAMARRHQRAAAIGGGFLMALAFYSYDPARVVIPIILLGLWAELGGRFKDHVRLYWPAALVFLIIAIPVAYYNLTSGSQRLGRISVFTDQSLGAAIAEALMNYVHHYNPLFLFTHGDANVRHSMPMAGLIAWGETPFFVIGLTTLLRWKRSGSRLLLFWLLAAPAAAALTTDGIPHALRSILFFPVVHLISARGAGLLLQQLNWRGAMAAVGVACLVTAALNYYSMSKIMPRHFREWQYGVLESLEVMYRENPQGPNVLSAEVPYAVYYALFFEQTPPEDFQERGGDALKTLIMMPGSQMPSGTLVARPANVFDRAQGLDVKAPTGGEGAVMRISY